MCDWVALDGNSLDFSALLEMLFDFVRLSIVIDIFDKN
jgi:hypothetical protein